MARITESTFPEKAPVVDAENGIIRGVKVIGFESRNGRRYPQQVLSAALRKYEGVRVFVDHPRRSELAEDRGFRDWAGNIRSARMESDGVYGDLHLRTKAPDYEALVEAAQKHWSDFGLSHVAECKMTSRDGKDVAEAIEEVFSVDIVCEPATTNGLFESHRKRPMKTTLKKFVEAIKGGDATSRKVVVEMLEASPEMASVEMDEPAADASPDDAIKAGFKAMISAVVDDDSLDSAAMISKIKEILKAKDKVEGTNTPAPTETPAEGDKPTEESAKLARKLALLESKTMLLESNREATDVRVKALAAADEADRKALLESWPVKESAPQRTTGRPSSSPPAGDTTPASKTFESAFDDRVAAARTKIAESRKR